jgi:hypothetical protein
VTDAARWGRNPTIAAVPGSNPVRYGVFWEDWSTAGNSFIGLGVAKITGGSVARFPLLGGGRAPAAAYGDGSFLVAWISDDYSHPAGSEPIEAALVDELYMILSAAPLEVSGNSELMRSAPNASWDGTQFTVVWHALADYGPSVVNTVDIHGARVARGSTGGLEFRQRIFSLSLAPYLVEAAVSDESAPAIVAGPTGTRGGAVAFSHAHQEPGAERVVFRLLSLRSKGIPCTEGGQCVSGQCGTNGVCCEGGCACDRCDAIGACIEPTLNCFDGTDHDCDGVIGCDEVECSGATCGGLGQICVPDQTGGGDCVCPTGLREEANCSDGTDDDCDGRIDCADPDCKDRECGLGMICANFSCSCAGHGPETGALCNDGIDNDCDGTTDCDDTSCDGSECAPGFRCKSKQCVCYASVSDESAACNDGIDNDCDGYADCSDEDCEYKECGPNAYCEKEACVYKEETAVCDDGIDNDKDGSVDCDDSDCKDKPCAPGKDCKNFVCQ